MSSRVLEKRPPDAASEPRRAPPRRSGVSDVSSKAFYDQFSTDLAAYSRTRARYLDAVDRVIVARCKGGVKSFLDVGCGDGRRGAALSRRIKARRTVLVDESPAMVDIAAERAAECNVREADVSASDFETAERFELITCLWNVLGHIPAARRVAALRNIRRHLSPGGRVFIDVNNRHNLAAYGIRRVASNLVRGAVRGDEVGDITLVLRSRSGPITTHSHIFTDRELRRLLGQAGLVVGRRWSIDYGQGTVARWTWMGQLLYECGAVM